MIAVGSTKGHILIGAEHTLAFKLASRHLCVTVLRRSCVTKFSMGVLDVRLVVTIIQFLYLGVQDLVV